MSRHLGWFLPVTITALVGLALALDIPARRYSETPDTLVNQTPVTQATCDRIAAADRMTEDELVRFMGRPPDEHRTRTVSDVKCNWEILVLVWRGPGGEIWVSLEDGPPEVRTQRVVFSAHYYPYYPAKP